MKTIFSLVWCYLYIHDDFSWLFIEGIFLTAHKVSLCMSQLVFILSFWFYYHQRRLAPSHSLSSNSRGSYTHTFCDFHNKGSCFYESAPHRADFITLGKFQFSNSLLEFFAEIVKWITFKFPQQIWCWLTNQKSRFWIQLCDHTT